MTTILKRKKVDEEHFYTYGIIEFSYRGIRTNWSDNLLVELHNNDYSSNVVLNISEDRNNAHEIEISNYEDLAKLEIYDIYPINDYPELLI